MKNISKIENKVFMPGENKSQESPEVQAEKQAPVKKAGKNKNKEMKQ
jgi:hypothetical protein